MSDTTKTTRVVIDGRQVDIRELHTGIFNAFDAETGQRLIIAVELEDGWWLGVRIGHERRHMHVPEGVEEVTRRLLATP